MDRIKALFEGEKEEPKKKFRLPWEKEVKPVKKGGFAGVKGMQKKMMEQLTERAKTAITGGVSGVLVLLTMYKVISSRESVRESVGGVIVVRACVRACVCVCSIFRA